MISMKLRLSLMTAAMALSFPSLAFAELEGVYVSGAAGGSYNENSTVKGSFGKGSALYNPDIAGDAALGYAFGNGVRVEAEGVYRNSIAQGIKGGIVAPGKTGNLDAYGGIANVIYAYNTGTAFTPFGGGGLGAINVNPQHLDGLVDGNRMALAYQATLGVEYALASNLALSVAYKYLATPEYTKFMTGNGTLARVAYENHAVLLGVRYSFGTQKAAAPPPSPPPVLTKASAPAARVEVPQTYLVFFDFDKSAVTPAGEQILAKAAAAALQGKKTQIIVTGYTDTVGSAKYNMALSMRRAKAAKAVLTSHGVSTNEIVTAGKGKSEPRVPTKDGVREPQNRRVEIVFR